MASYNGGGYALFLFSQSAKELGEWGEREKKRPCFHLALRSNPQKFREETLDWMAEKGYEVEFGALDVGSGVGMVVEHLECNVNERVLVSQDVQFVYKY